MATAKQSDYILLLLYTCMIFQDLCHIHVEEVLKRHNGVLAILGDIKGRDKGLLGLVELMVLGEELVPGRGIDQSLSDYNMNNQLKN